MCFQVIHNLVATIDIEVDNFHRIWQRLQIRYFHIPFGILRKYDRLSPMIISTVNVPRKKTLE